MHACSPLCGLRGCLSVRSGYVLCLEKSGSPETGWCFRSSNRRAAGKIHGCARSVLSSQMPERLEGLPMNVHWFNGTTHMRSGILWPGSSERRIKAHLEYLWNFSHPDYPGSHPHHAPLDGGNRQVCLALHHSHRSVPRNGASSTQTLPKIPREIRRPLDSL